MFRIYAITEFRFYGAEGSTEGSILDEEFYLDIRFTSLLPPGSCLHL